jgi:EAL domain-containing protein (putative c-di-GMP-specific phosphodiesterase class I)/GGDEF domain-containing protein
MFLHEARGATVQTGWWGVGDLAGERLLDDRDGLGRVLAYSHRYDFQTGFLNYRPFEEALASLLRNRLAGWEFALLWIDVQNLRQEFLLRGAEGDEAMVRQIAESLRETVGADGLLGRFGGGSFLAAMPAAKFNTEDRYRIQTIADSLRTLVVSAREIKPEIGAGAAFFPADTESSPELIRFAGLAAARAASVKCTAVIPFHPEMNNQILRDFQLEMEMHKGLAEGQFGTDYQPKVDLKTGYVLGAEALMRWRHPQRGQVSPDEFIPVAERSRLIQCIFESCLRSALESVQQWRNQGLELPVISINVTAADVRRQDFVRDVRRIVEEFAIAPTELELEVTESMLVDDEGLLDVRLRQLRGAGVRISIDDFGARYTSFNMLKRLPLNAMKIDRCFVNGIHRSENMRTLCQSVLAMAHSLTLHTVAEGIEDRDELEILRQMGCNAGQGLLFQPPIPAEEFAGFLRMWPVRNSFFGFAQPRRVTSAFGT